MRETIMLNQQEQKRLQVLNQTIEGGLTAVEAGELLGLSERQVRILLAAYREEGVAALAHGNWLYPEACPAKQKRSTLESNPSRDSRMGVRDMPWGS
jgi:transposase